METLGLDTTVAAGSTITILMAVVIVVVMILIAIAPLFIWGATSRTARAVEHQTEVLAHQTKVLQALGQQIAQAPQAPLTLEQKMAQQRKR